MLQLIPVKKKNKHVNFQGEHLPCVAVTSPIYCNILKECFECEKSSIGSSLRDLELGTTTSSLSFLSYFLCHSLIRSRIPFILLGLHCLESHLWSLQHISRSLEHPELQQGSPLQPSGKELHLRSMCARQLAFENPYSYPQENLGIQEARDSTK